ncbi:hypothetical protein Tco_1131130 [Tanacetum coccineum]
MEGNRGLRYGLRAENEWKRKVVNGGGHEEEKCEKDDVRTVEADDKEINMALFNKCVIGEVKSLCYLTKIVNFCEEQGINNVEVNILDGLEIMMVFDTPATVSNIFNSNDHGLRRWVHKLRRWSKHYILPGRLTWVSIIGVPVSCWSEPVFKKITAFKVDVIEEVRDIVELEIEVAFNNSKEGNGSKESQKMDDGIDMIISDSESNEDDCEEETDSEDDDDDVGGGGRPEDDGGRKRDEDEESRCSDMYRVCETPEEEVINEQKVAAPRENLHGNGGTEDVNKLEKQDKHDSYFCYNINENVYENNMTGQRKISGPWCNLV